MEKVKKIFWSGIVLLLFSIIILAAVLLPFFWPEKDIVEEPVALSGNGLAEGLPDVPGDCQKITGQKEQKQCLDRKRLSVILYSTKNIKDCLAFDDLAFRTDCLFRLARVRTDARYCEKLAGEKDRYRCIQDIAINSNNADLCGKSGGNVYETRECADRVKATNIGTNGETSLPVDYCAKIKTLEYGKLCVLYASKNGVELTGSTGEKDFTDSWTAHLIYQSAKTAVDCEKINFEGGRQACKARIENNSSDYDQDGISDYSELWFGTDPAKSDTDGDGLNDYDEMAHDCDPSSADTDRDGLNDYAEVKVHQSSCSNPDSDNDGIKDGQAVKSGKDPVSNDPDHDGLASDVESRIGTDPNNRDTDADGTSDGDEWNNGLDPLNTGQGLFDTDKDGLSDINEIFYGTDRFKTDTDGDGKSDLAEVESQTNPAGSGNMDFDMDGLTDLQEESYGTNPGVADTDGDGKSDLNEIMGGTDPLK